MRRRLTWHLEWTRRPWQRAQQAERARAAGSVEVIVVGASESAAEGDGVAGARVTGGPALASTVNLQLQNFHSKIPYTLGDYNDQS